MPCKYDRATGFFEGMAAVQMNGKYGYTYYKLWDLGTALGFKVDLTAQRGIFIETK